MDSEDIVTSQVSSGKSHHKKLFIIVLALVVLIIGSILTVSAVNRKRANDRLLFKQSLLKDAAKNYDLSKSSELKNIVDRIVLVKDYDKDPDYMYVVTFYYYEIESYDSAIANYNKLAAIYSPDTVFDKLITSSDRYMTYERFTELRSFFAIQKAAMKRNMMSVPPQETN